MIIKDFINFFLLTLSLVSVTLALEGECIEIKDIVSKENPYDGSFFKNNVDTCEVENGKVTKLAISGRSISLDTFKKILDNKTSISILEIRETDLTQSHIDAIGALSSLEELEFEYCNFGENLNLKSLYHINTLTFYCSDFTKSIKDFRVFKNLKILYINLVDNIPSDIIESIFDLYFLENLYLNDIKDVDWSKLKLDTLKEFYCGECYMKSIPDSLFQSGNLQLLSLYGNEITEIPDDIKKLQNLKKLDLTNNQKK